MLSVCFVLPTLVLPRPAHPHLPAYPTHSHPAFPSFQYGFDTLHGFGATYTAQPEA